MLNRKSNTYQMQLSYALDETMNGSEAKRITFILQRAVERAKESKIDTLTTAIITAGDYHPSELNITQKAAKLFPKSTLPEKIRVLHDIYWDRDENEFLVKSKALRTTAKLYYVRDEYNNKIVEFSHYRYFNFQQEYSSSELADFVYLSNFYKKITNSKMLAITGLKSFTYNKIAYSLEIDGCIESFTNKNSCYIFTGAEQQLLLSIDQDENGNYSLEKIPANGLNFSLQTPENHPELYALLQATIKDNIAYLKSGYYLLPSSLIALPAFQDISHFYLPHMIAMRQKQSTEEWIFYTTEEKIGAGFFARIRSISSYHYDENAQQFKQCALENKTRAGQQKIIKIFKENSTSVLQVAEQEWQGLQQADHLHPKRINKNFTIALRQSRYAKPPVFILDKYDQDLAAFLATNHNLSVKQRFIIAQRLLLATTTLHAKNIVHNDIKPENILLNQDNFELALADFNLCHNLKHVNKPKCQGTPLYLGPESISFDKNNNAEYFETKPDLNKDMFAIGVTLAIIFGLDYKDPLIEEVIAYKVHKNTSLNLLNCIQSSCSGISEQFAQALAALILSCLCKDPLQRVSANTALQRIEQIYLQYLLPASVGLSGSTALTEATKTRARGFSAAINLMQNAEQIEGFLTDLISELTNLPHDPQAFELYQLAMASKFLAACDTKQAAVEIITTLLMQFKQNVSLFESLKQSVGSRVEISYLQQMQTLMTVDELDIAVRRQTKHLLAVKNKISTVTSAIGLFMSPVAATNTADCSIEQHGPDLKIL